MEVANARFEWNRGNRNKYSKHGVTLSAVESAPSRSVAVFPDTDLYYEEEAAKNTQTIPSTMGREPRLAPTAISPITTASEQNQKDDDDENYFHNCLHNM